MTERSNIMSTQQPVPATQQAPQQSGVGNSGFDHNTAADFLNGKTVSDEAMRKFVNASRWAHDDRVGLQATLLSVRNELAAREAEIALLKTELMDAEVAPQQEAQEPVAWINEELTIGPNYGKKSRMRKEIKVLTEHRDFLLREMTKIDRDPGNSGHYASEAVSAVCADMAANK